MRCDVRWESPHTVHFCNLVSGHKNVFHVCHCGSSWNTVANEGTEFIGRNPVIWGDGALRDPNSAPPAGLADLNRSIWIVELMSQAVHFWKEQSE